MSTCGLFSFLVFSFVGSFDYVVAFLHVLQALSKTLTVDELFYLKGQFALLEPNKDGCITLENIKMVSIDAGMCRIRVQNNSNI